MLKLLTRDQLKTYLVGIGQQLTSQNITKKELINLFQNRNIDIPDDVYNKLIKEQEIKIKKSREQYSLTRKNNKLLNKTQKKNLDFPIEITIERFESLILITKLKQEILKLKYPDLIENLN